MEQFYLFNHKKKLPNKEFTSSLNSYGKKNLIPCLLVVFACFLTSASFSQTSPDAPFNQSFWNNYADDLQLGPSAREEFISSHKRRHTIDSLAFLNNPQNQGSNAKPLNTNNTIAAGACVNADFELGNMTGWTRSSGFHPGYNALGCCPNPNGQQTIMTGAGNDPYGGFPLVYPGGNFSLRLGNNGVNGEADRIEQTFLVSAANANFSYKYAVVFEDPNHPINQQPFFQVEMVDALGAAVPCTFYYVAAGSGIPGFFNSPVAGVIYKPWSTVMVDLTPYIGQNITIRFSTYDCSLGGHFGYAYIDGVCESFSSGGSGTICAGTNTTFCAPEGVSSYTWNGPGVTNVVGQCAVTSAPGIYTVTTTLFTGCPGPTFTYTLQDQPAPVASAGLPTTVCANNNTVTLSGIITGFSSTPVWSTGGSGTFTSLTSLNTLYTPSAADNAAGSVTITLTTAGNGVCPAATDQKIISITPSPVVNAGTGGSTCNSNAFALNGSVVAGATTGSWSTSGTGAFSPAATALNASYTPSPVDISAGSVTLTLTSTNNGNCFSNADTVIIKIRQPATVNAGANQLLCSTTPTIGIAGLIGGGGATGIWSSSGPGGFSPANTNINTTYSIMPADVTNGQVTFTLSSTNNGPCPVVRDTVKMKIIMPSTVTAGPNQFVCSTSGSINLAGSVIGFSNTGSWSSSGLGAFNPGASLLNTGYVITPADISLGSVIFTLTSTNNGPCPAVSDTVKMRVRIPATVNLGANQSFCSTTSSINLAGLIGGGGSTGLWSTSGSGAFAPSNTVIITSYGITAGDIAAGSVIFTLTSTNNGPCAAVQDSVIMPIVRIATVSAGANNFICSNTGVVNLLGSITSPSNTVSWSSSGLGSFLPSGSILSPTYNLTAADINNGSVTFTISSTNNGPCPVVRDSVMITIKKLAVINAGLNQNICSNNPTFNLNGTMGGGATTVSWTSSGIGNFVPSATTLNTTYNATAADINSGSVIFTLTSTNDGPCPSVSDSVKMVITKMATITAGPNQYVCSSPGSINLSGSINSPSNTVSWSSNGTGNFSSGSVLAPVYNLTALDINAGSVTFSISSTNNGPCPVVSDSVMVTIKKLAVINAGLNQNICSNNPTFNLNGAIGGGATTVSWTSSGTGNFSPNTTNLNTAYNANAMDINSGIVIFTLTSTNNGPCPAVSDSVKMRVTKIATVTAGPNLYVCSNAGVLNLAGSVNSPSNTTVWTVNGTGAFLPNAGVANNTYSFSALDVNMSLLTFTITSTNNGPCPVVSDTVRMRIMKMPVANAGANQSICATQNSISLTGNVTGGGFSGTWSTSGNGSFNANPPALVASYNMSPQDISSGTVTFTLTSQNSAPCPEASSIVSVSISTQALVVAGPSQTVCSSNGSIVLTGSASGGAGTVLWTSSGTGSFSPDNSGVQTTYFLTPGDVLKGNVSFTLASTNNGSCSKSESNLVVVVKEKAKVNAGADKTICSNQQQVTLQGVISGVTTSGTWTGNGAGSFTPNLPAGNYSIAPGDIALGNITLVLTSINNDICPVVSDTMKITIETKPQITVKADTSICDKFSMIPLSYTATSSTPMQWQTSGSGVFLPTNAPSATHYSLSPADKTGPNVSLMLGTLSSGVCGYSGATMKINVLKGPRADFSASTYTMQIPSDPIQFTNLSSSADTYSWSFGDGNSATITDPSHAYSDVGFYNVTLTTRNSNNCVDVTEKVITVITDVKFATAFTPNTNGGNGGYYDVNDYSNDVFFPFARGVVEYDMMIFNRWGELIFKSNDIKIGWDGYFNGKLCQQDTYVWKVSMAFFDGRKYNNTGSITLLR